MDALTKTVSFQSDTWSPISQEPTVLKVLKEIKSDKYAQSVGFLRRLLSNGDIEGYGMHKKTLPAVTFCATFNFSRKKNNLKDYNYLLVLDIDKLSSNEYQRIREALTSDNYVLSVWDSPSGNGVKGLVSLSYEFPINSANLDLSHKSAFQKISTYFSDAYNITLDESGSDTTRLCFLSYDASIVIKSESQPFIIGQSDIIVPKIKEKANRVVSQSVSSRDILYNPQNKNSALNRKNIQSIIRFLEKRSLSITSNYDNWYKVAYAIADTFTYDLGEKYFISLCKLDGAKYHEENSKNILKYSYVNGAGLITMSTIIHFAIEKGYLINSQRSEVSETVAAGE
jgi:hypothetical protein